MTIWEAVLLAVVEGLTEYIPVSSTGHLIITSALMGIHKEAFTKDFTIMVQFGAILSVLVLYWRRFLSGFAIYKKLFVAFLPAAIIGLLVKDHIDAVLDNVAIVAVALILGGIVLVLMDRLFHEGPKTLDVPQVSYRRALAVGFFQCLAFVPGVSRSAATIIGGLTQNLNRKAAAEFSFLLAVPTLSGASAVKLKGILPTLQADQAGILIIGNLISFVVGIITIRAFIGLLGRVGFRWFGYYRIAVGTLILILMAAGVDLAML